MAKDPAKAKKEMMMVVVLFFVFAFLLYGKYQEKQAQEAKREMWRKQNMAALGTDPSMPGGAEAKRGANVVTIKLSATDLFGGTLKPKRGSGGKEGAAEAAGETITLAGVGDPFEPPIKMDMTPDIGPEVAMVNLDFLSLEGYVWGDVDPKAIINGEVLKVGDDIEGAMIIKISREGVMLHHTEGDTLLTLKDELY
ncbi:MAG: hypothetical protein HQ593_04800 [Candidatus Omnitrophica bacterium]|nr:hypothetical protein [Candidatus Omnitrophota bacterium]